MFVDVGVKQLWFCKCIPVIARSQLPKVLALVVALDEFFSYGLKKSVNRRVSFGENPFGFLRHLTAPCVPNILRRLKSDQILISKLDSPSLDVTSSQKRLEDFC